MTFKRNVDRLPIIPKDATVHNVTCNFCIVGCGYKAYSWNINREGGTVSHPSRKERTGRSDVRSSPRPATRGEVEARSAEGEGTCGRRDGVPVTAGGPSP